MKGSGITRSLNERNTTMKTTKLPLLLIVAAMAAALFTNAHAAEPLLSPRAKDSAIVRVSGTETDHLDRGLPTASPKARALQASLARISGSEADHLDRDVSSVSPKLATTFPDVAANARALSNARPRAMAACKTMKAGDCTKDCCKTKGTCSMPCCKS